MADRAIAASCRSCVAAAGARKFGLQDAPGLRQSLESQARAASASVVLWRQVRGCAQAPSRGHMRARSYALLGIAPILLLGAAAAPAAARRETTPRTSRSSAFAARQLPGRPVCKQAARCPGSGRLLRQGAAAGPGQRGAARTTRFRWRRARATGHGWRRSPVNLSAVQPAHRLAHAFLGIAAFKAGRYAEAEEHFKGGRHPVARADERAGAGLDHPGPGKERGGARRHSMHRSSRIGRTPSCATTARSSPMWQGAPPMRVPRTGASRRATSAFSASLWRSPATPPTPAT